MSVPGEDVVIHFHLGGVLDHDAGAPPPPMGGCPTVVPNGVSIDPGSTTYLVLDTVIIVVVYSVVAERHGLAVNVAPEAMATVEVDFVVIYGQASGSGRLQPSGFPGWGKVVGVVVVDAIALHQRVSSSCQANTELPAAAHIVAQ